MRLLRIPEPFDHPDFLFEPKLDGFRALAHVRGHHWLISRNGHTFKQWPQLAEDLAHAVRTHSAVLDGEICCLEPKQLALVGDYARTSPAYLPACCRMVWTCPPIVIVPCRSAPVFCSTE
jgi:ATP-dependent DNA ligase